MNDPYAGLEYLLLEHLGLFTLLLSSGPPLH